MIPDRLPLARRLRRVFWPVSIEREVADEISGHIELQTRRYIDAGMSEADARAAARARFGNIDIVGAECRNIREGMEAEMERAELKKELGMDAAYAVRTLRRSPLFAAVAILTIALAVGANTAIFSVVNAVLLRGLPYRNADRIAVLWNSYGATAESQTAVAAPEFFDLQKELRAHDGVAAVTNQPATLIVDGAEPERLQAYVVSPNTFDLLGASPMLGRGFGGDDGTPGAGRVVILSHALWQRRFGGDPTVVGRHLNVAGFDRIVVGIMPPDVRFPDAPLGFLREQADLWIPSTWDSYRSDGRGDQRLAVVVRRARGVTAKQGDADLAAVASQWRAAFPDRYASLSAKNWHLVETPLRDQMVGSARIGLFVIAAAVGLVLLIACVNVANLLLARGTARQREMAIRLALGAGRARLVRQLLTESVVLAAAGGLIGVGLAWFGVRALVSIDAAHLPRLAETRIDLRVLGFSFALSIITGLLVGVVPALQQSRKDLRGGLSAGSRSATGGRAHHRLTSSLVVAQVAMTLVVLVGAGLLVRSFVALQRVDLGFVPQNVLRMQLTVPRTKYDSASKVVAFYRELVTRVGATPGVSSVGAGFPMPMGSDGWSGSFNVEGEPDGPNDPEPHAEYGLAMPGYFKTMRIPMVSGRDFEPTDTRESPHVVIIDEALAKQHWPGQSAIGKHLNPNRDPAEWFTVVGVVGHVHKSGPRSDGEPQIYMPFGQSLSSTLSIVVRTSGSPTALAQPMRTVVRSLDNQIPVTTIEPIESLVSRAVAKERFNTMLVGLFGVIALLLASIGLYGVMAYLVSQRTREIGIRMALGGEPGAIRRMILREGLGISATGLVIGGGVALLGARVLNRLLFGVAATDAPTYLALSALMLVVGAVASYGPARRATRVEPVTALRE